MLSTDKQASHEQRDTVDLPRSSVEAHIPANTVCCTMAFSPWKGGGPGTPASCAAVPPRSYPGSVPIIDWGHPITQPIYNSLYQKNAACQVGSVFFLEEVIIAEAKSLPEG